jgi:uncharacterized protein with PQ loop repeat
MKKVTGVLRRISFSPTRSVPRTSLVTLQRSPPLDDDGSIRAAGSRPVARPWPRPNGTRSTMTAALGFLAAALSISLVWPQVWLSCRRGRTRGLSPTSAWLAVGLNASWLTFGLLTRDPAQIITNAVVGAGNTAVLAALLFSQAPLRTRTVLLRSAAGAAALVAVAAGSALSVVALGADRVEVGTALGALVSVVGAGTACVQPLSMLRDRTQDLSGLSAIRYRLGAGANASWLSYAVLRHEPAVLAAAGVGLGCAVLVCTLLARRPATAAVRVLPARGQALATAA